MHETHRIGSASRMVIKSPAARLTFDNQHYLLPAGSAVAAMPALASSTTALGRLTLRCSLFSRIEFPGN